MDKRYKTTRNISIINAITNSILAIFKIITGYVGNSHALVADGIHSFSDVISDTLVVIAAKMGDRNPDAGHPYGHRRIETIAAIIIAIILLLIGGGIIYDTLQHLTTKTPTPAPTKIVLFVAIISIITNELLYHITKKAGERVNSNLLISNAWHNRGDALVSAIVLMSAIGTRAGITHLDAIGAIIIALMIARIAIKMIWSNINELIDAGVDAKTLSTIQHIITTTAGVVAVHQLRTRLHGGNIFIDVHIIVHPTVSVSEGHYIGDQVLLQLMNQIKEIRDITVHIDPEDDEKNHPCINLPNRVTLTELLTPLWRTLPGYQQLKKTTLHYLNGKITIEIYLPINTLNNNHYETLRQQYQAAISHIDYIEKITLGFLP